MPAQSAPVRTYTFLTAGDNYSPVRTWHYGQAAEYVHPWRPAAAASVFWIDAPTIPNPHRALYLIDVQGTVTPFYVAGWSAADGLTERQAGAVLLYPMSAADPQTSASRWSIGPRRAFHLILSTEERSPIGHPAYVPTPERPAVRTPLDDLRA